jgi:hypothetical protein
MKFQSYIFEKTKTLEFHKELNDKIWNKNKEDKYILDEKIRLKLLEIADAWVEFAKIPKKYIKNILFTGSLANYNYTELSDIDLHILVDYSSVKIDFDFLYDYYKDKKSIWSENHDIKIKGYPVELYAQPMSEKPHTNQGVYSVTNNKWIKEPEPVEIDIEGDVVFNRKLSEFKEQIEDIIEGKGTLKNIEKFREKIRKMRGAAIAKSGEFSQENLIFKSLRNEGYLEKLSNYHHELVDKKLSLENCEVSKAKNLNERANRLLGEVSEPGQELSREEMKDEIYKEFVNDVNKIKKEFTNLDITTAKSYIMVDKEQSCISFNNWNTAVERGKYIFLGKPTLRELNEYYKINEKSKQGRDFVRDGKSYIRKDFVDLLLKMGYTDWWANYSNLYIRKYYENGDTGIKETIVL